MKLEMVEKNIGATVADRTTDLVVEARELLAGATNGPYSIGPDNGFRYRVANIVHARNQALALVMSGFNAALFASAPSLIAAMADEIEALRKHLADVNHDFEEANKFCDENHVPWR